MAFPVSQGRAKALPGYNVYRYRSCLPGRGLPPSYAVTSVTTTRLWKALMISRSPDRFIVEDPRPLPWTETAALPRPGKLSARRSNWAGGKTGKKP